MIFYQAFLLGILVLLLANLLVNLRILKRTPRGARPSRFPLVSVLVPARDEERSLGRLLTSLSLQTYPHYEVLVLDDNSTDGTARIAEEAARKDSRIRLLRGKPLPVGWQGKSFACSELAEEARGELFLFTDADTSHVPDCLTAAVAESERTRADLFTLVTHLELISFWEKIFLPLLPYTFLTYVPLLLSARGPVPQFAFANGQFLLFRRQAYETLGGHAAVREAMVEDVWLARRARRLGLRGVLQDGSEIVSVRMYRGLRETWEGFSKNLFAGFEYSLAAILPVLLFSLLAYAAPYGFLLGGIFFRQDPLGWILLPGLQILSVTFMRFLLARRLGFGSGFAWTHALAILFFLGIAGNSICKTLWGRGVLWKGRRYDFRRSQGVGG